MFSKQSYVAKAKKEASNYLKMTASMGIIRSQVCAQLANELSTLGDHDFQAMLTLLKKHTNVEITSKPLKGCHRHFHEKLKMLYKQIKYDNDLQEIITRIDLTPRVYVD